MSIGAWNLGVKKTAPDRGRSFTTIKMKQQALAVIMPVSRATTGSDRAVRLSTEGACDGKDALHHDRCGPWHLWKESYSREEIRKRILRA